MADYYAGIHIGDDGSYAGDYAYIHQYMKALKWATGEKWKNLNRHPMMVGSPPRAAEVNAGYKPVMNEIYVPAGMLQPPMIENDLPAMVNYARIGSILGHEMFHGFDSDGMQFGGDEMAIIDWSNEEVSHVEKGFGCIRDLYKDLKLEGLGGSRFSIRPPSVQDEAFADIHGVQVAYEAWKAAESARPGKTLPGLEQLSAEKQFWILQSSIWCGVDSPRMADVSIGDVHPPGSLRTWKPATSADGWYEAFGCAKKKDTCRVLGSET